MEVNMYSKIKNWQNCPIKKIDLFYYEDKNLNENDFYKYKNGEFCHYSKADIRNHIDVYDPTTFLPFIKEFNIPFMPNRWITYIEQAKKKNTPLKYVFGKYLAYCKLWSFKNFHFNDSEQLQNL